MGRYTRSNYLNKFTFIAVVVAVFIAGWFKIADLDFWWHLKTGEIIWAQKAFQHNEIYSHTSAGNEYIDHEWLFQLILHAAYSLAGAAGVIFMKCAVLAVVYLLIARFLIKENHDPLIVLALILLSILGARTRFIERPEIFSALFLVSIYLLVENYLRYGGVKKLLWVPGLMFVWANTHAAVILGFVVQGALLAGYLFDRALHRQGHSSFYPHEFERKPAAIVAVLAASFLVALLNPYGFRTLLVPFELTTIIDSNLLNNQEWQQPPVWRLPFFYACWLLTFGIFVWRFRRLHAGNFLLAAFFGYVSLKYVRNVGLFCMLMPLFLEPYLKTFELKRLPSRVLGAISAALFALIPISSPFEFGIGEASYFPDSIVKFTEESELRGNLLNSYAFGGYLIWSFYPERKIFIDGRNEVYLPLLQEITDAREDNRRWEKMLSRYQIEYVLLNYVDDLEKLTVLDQSGKSRVTYAPFSSTHFPRTDWALVYWDDDGMVLVKRNGVNKHLLAQEYRWIYPEGHRYQEALLQQGIMSPSQVAAELHRKLQEQPQCQRAMRLLRALQG